MKKILGLDIGTNSIGWALIESNAYDENVEKLDGRIINLGSRIIPMDAAALAKFESGIPESKAAVRRGYRGARRLNQRYKLRRSRLVNVLQILNWLPENFPNERNNPKLFKKIDKHSINTYLPYSDELKSEAFEFFGIKNQINKKGEASKISEDWIIYFLKTKALREKITLAELARILYHYNQRRGFKSSRKDKNDTNAEIEGVKVSWPIYEKWIEIITITNIENIGKGNGKDKDFTFYELTCKTNNLEFTAIKKRKNPLDWLNKDKEVEITKTTKKDGEVSYKISEVDPKAWENRKLALEKDVIKSELNISEYYLKKLKSEPGFRIKQRIVDRSFYQKELKEIWDYQSKYYQSEFNNKSNLAEIADSLYKNNTGKNKEIKSRDLFHLFFNDIIYFQRKLKSQKAQLANCTYETKTYKNNEGNEVKIGVKVTHRSNPFFQEFRIWQTINNLKVIQKKGIINGKQKIDIDVSNQFLATEAKENLFELFDNSKEIKDETILTTLGLKKIKSEDFNYKLNYPEDTSFPGNETKALFKRIFKKCNFINEGNEILQNIEKFHLIWHIIYSLPEENDIKSALRNKNNFDLPENVVEELSKLPEFKSQYSSLSQRAILNLLPLMRIGKFWNLENLIPKAKNTKSFSTKPTIDILNRIEKVLSGEDDDSISLKLREEIVKRNLSEPNNFQGLQTFLAAYVAYGRHSERQNEDKYLDISDFKINEIIPYNSIRNPVVEKVIRETLKLVKDVWATYDRPDYIHVELGRELKKNNKEKEQATEINKENKLAKDRIATLLLELKYPNFNPESPADIDKFRLWQQQGGKQGTDNFNELFKGGNSEFIKDVDIEKYKLWAEQGYRSPYSGKPIPLSWLFSIPKRVEIDHIIPKSKFFDDSFGNKVLVEAEFNDLKRNSLAIEFIERYQAEPPIELSDGSKRKVLDLESYKAIVDEMFSKNKKKLKHLNLYEVPEDFVERQLNDTKYISRSVAQFLRPVAKGIENIDENNKITIDEGVIYTSGGITSDLKQKWGLNKAWKEILKPRFERLEKITGDNLIIPNKDKVEDYHFGKEYKRIDHRHHALDALVIACTTRKHIKYLNSLNSLSNDKSDIAKNNEWQQWKYLLNKKKENEKQGMTDFATPWGSSSSFYTDVKQALEGILVSHKPTSKLIAKTINKYLKWAPNKDGKLVKKEHLQVQPIADEKYWVAVKQSLFAQPYGKVYMPQYDKEVKLGKAIQLQIEFITKHNYKWNSEHWRIAKSDVRKQIDRIIGTFDHDEKAILKHFENNHLKDKQGHVIETIDMLQFKKMASKKVTIDETFTKDKIDKMPHANLKSNWLTNLLTEHLAQYGDKPKEAFKGEALEELNKKARFPINKVTRIESGEKIELNNKLLDGDSGVNQYFVIHNEKILNKKTGNFEIKRKYFTPKFLDMIKYLGQGLKDNLSISDIYPSPEFTVLSPGDMVYVPEIEENLFNINWDDNKRIADRIYILRSADGLFIKSNIAKAILPYDRKTKMKGEIGWDNKSDKTMDEDEILIKQNCIKLIIDRLGNIKPS